MSAARLRTKTGCLTCRKRRVKCSENRPHCRNCSTRRLPCVWPTARDLYDRRHHCLRSNSRTTISEKANPHAVDGLGRRDVEMLSSSLLLPAHLVTSTSTVFRCDLEYKLFHHFCDNFISTLLLPNSHPGFRRDYCTFLGGLSLQFETVRSGILACSAINLYMLTNDERLRSASLTYYAHAILIVNKALENFNSLIDKPSDDIVNAIIYLYIYSLWGLDAAEDASKHVMGAVHAVNLRYDRSQNAFSMSRASDRVTAESVLYQSCLLAIRRPFLADFKVDDDLIMRVECTLQSLTFLDASAAANSPVLGVPLELYRLILSIIRLTSSRVPPNQVARSQLQGKISVWESTICDFGDSTGNIPTERLQQDLSSLALVLYVLAASLLLDLALTMMEQKQTSMAGLPRLGFRWQLQTALGILRCPECNGQWTRCFLAPWPLQIFGYVVEEEKDISLVRSTLHKTREHTGYGEVTRLLGELAPIWRDRIERESPFPSFPVIPQEF
ncbi:Zn(II)2Cys6 transcription factor [Aspergillus lucknowensis]|uniref:Zn(2)-C6 fungal-type domain-containing protein n=1 Tax=Aspergillus lucknowensis TaxID=176173 RepID=A0ABR4LE36_9EURO